MRKGDTLDAKVEQCVKLIEDANCISVLTGAGISTNAGIPDFRGPKGLYVTRQYDPDKVFNIDYFHRDPVPFFDFARDFIGLEETIKPTQAHTFLSQLELAGKIKGVVTQNIDSLHQMAGSKHVLEMHGSFWQSHCLGCDKEFTLEDFKQKILAEQVAHCTCGGVIKPDIVFFGEAVKCFSEASALAEQSDLFFVMGTSCTVYPAAMLPNLVSGKIVIMNMTEVEASLSNVALSVTNDIDEFCQALSEKLRLSSR